MTRAALRLIAPQTDERVSEPFELVLAALRQRGCRVRHRSSDSVRATCPTHADTKPSLVVTRRADRVLMRCFAGCRVSEVLRALDLRMADLFSTHRTTPPTPKAIAAVYSYTDIDGTILAEKVRFLPKGFRWRRLDAATGKEIWNLGDTAVTLYNLPALIDEPMIVITEGEKAVEMLGTHGIVATCPPAGASRWEPAWSETLWKLGCKVVVILADNDQPGRQHAERVAATCHDVRSVTPHDSDDPGLLVKVVHLPGLPSGGDVVDWLQNGQDASRLRQVIAEAPYWTPGSLERSRAQRKREQARRRQQHKRARDRQHRDARPTDCHAPNVREQTHQSLSRTECQVIPVTRHAVTHPERTSKYVTVLLQGSDLQGAA